jgi:hypothetical protein
MPLNFTKIQRVKELINLIFIPMSEKNLAFVGATAASTGVSDSSAGGTAASTGVSDSSAGGTAASTGVSDSSAGGTAASTGVSDSSAGGTTSLVETNNDFVVLNRRDRKFRRMTSFPVRAQWLNFLAQSCEDLFNPYMPIRSGSLVY